MTWLDDASEGVRAFDRARPRSLQKEVGWSEAGACRSAIGYRIDEAWETQTDTWAAQRGTALHDYLLPLLAKHLGMRCEVETSYRGIPGHADLVGAAEVDDLKTTTLDTSIAWRSDLKALRPKRIQAHGYAAGLVDAGELPEDCTVRILVVPVDGTFDDWWDYAEPFDRALADEGANRVEWVRGQVAAGLLAELPKDKPPTWCAKWCGFYGLCREDSDNEATGELPVITDEELAAAVTRYGEAHAIAAPAQKEKEALAPLIRGLRGTTESGWKVTTSRPGEPGEEPDPEAIAAFFAEHGAEVPMREKPGSSPRLTVTRLKAVNGK